MKPKVDHKATCEALTLKALAWIDAQAFGGEPKIRTLSALLSIQSSCPRRARAFMGQAQTMAEGILPLKAKTRPLIKAVEALDAWVDAENERLK